jgi:hypothetical protein
MKYKCYSIDQRINGQRTFQLTIEVVPRVGIHKHLGTRKKAGSELIFLRINFKISFFPFLQMLFTEKVSVLADFLEKIDLFEKNGFF